MGWACPTRVCACPLPPTHVTGEGAEGGVRANPRTPQKRKAFRIHRLPLPHSHPYPVHTRTRRAQKARRARGHGAGQEVPPVGGKKSDAPRRLLHLHILRAPLPSAGHHPHPHARSLTHTHSTPPHTHPGTALPRPSSFPTSSRPPRDENKQQPQQQHPPIQAVQHFPPFPSPDNDDVDGAFLRRRCRVAL